MRFLSLLLLGLCPCGVSVVMWSSLVLFVCFVGLFHIGNWNFWLVMA